MTHEAMSEPGPDGKCRICSAKLPEGSLRCAHCGAVYGESNRCPHCRTIADIKPSASLRFACAVCGAPRVPIDDPDISRSGKEVRVLEQAKRAHMHATAARAGAYVTGAFGIVSLLTALLALAFITPGPIGAAGLAVAVMVPFVLALYAWRLARRAGSELETLLDQAWALSASDVLQAKGKDLEPSQLARILRVDETQAEELMARLDVNDFLRTRVTDEADRAATSPERLRVSSTGSADQQEASESSDEPAQAPNKRAES